MCNHFSFLDGAMALYLSKKVFATNDRLKTFQVMVLKGQMKKRKWLKYLGGFSVAPGSRSINESLAHAREVLSKPGNLLLLYPQGNLESMYVRKIVFQDGINQILPRVEGDCQIIWTSILIEYFESFKPSLHFSMLDCGTNSDFDFDTITNRVNAYHETAMKRQFRFTNEDEK
ncbi:lysophospholipid acyltransferase family protein [Pedobacter planticolens]|nr:glycerol acyltransferase [Pedobacter planticolens]